MNRNSQKAEKLIPSHCPPEKPQPEHATRNYPYATGTAGEAQGPKDHRTTPLRAPAPSHVVAPRSSAVPGPRVRPGLGRFDLVQSLLAHTDSGLDPHLALDLDPDPDLDPGPEQQARPVLVRSPPCLVDPATARPYPLQPSNSPVGAQTTDRSADAVGNPLRRSVGDGGVARAGRG